eukprot:g1310.t1
MGLASAWKIAERVNVLKRENAMSEEVSVELIDTNHAVRGSWGSTRASHLSIEDNVLLKMNLIAMDEWDALESDEKDPIRVSVGRIFAGPLGSVCAISETLLKECPSDSRCQHARLTFEDVNQRWQRQIRLSDQEEGIYLPRGGFVVSVDRALDALRDAAVEAGVKISTEETVLAIDRSRKMLRTDNRSRQVPYDHLVLCAGPWTNKVLRSAKPALPLMPIVVSEEQTLDIGVPSDAEDNPYDRSEMPLFTWSEAGYKGVAENGKCRYFYTVPSTFAPGGLKIGYHRQGRLLENDEFVVSSEGSEAVEGFPHLRKEFVAEQSGRLDAFNESAVKEFVTQTLPSLDPSHILVVMRCLYQMSPDRQMILGSLDADNDIYVACGFSGGGFQHAPVIGAHMADLVLRRACDAHVESERANLFDEMDKKFTPRRFNK